MILTDREIQIAIEKNLVVVEPRPQPRAFSSTSLDLTLDPNITEFKELTGGVELVIDPSHDEYSAEETLAQITKRHVIDKESGYLLSPRQLVLGWTVEKIELAPHSRLAARIEGKSSLARLGLGIHITAPTIHSGFNGRLRLEMVNHGAIPVRLRPEMRVCQVIFEQTLGTPERGYQGQFSGQTVAPPVRRN